MAILKCNAEVIVVDRLEEDLKKFKEEVGTVFASCGARDGVQNLSTKT